MAMKILQIYQESREPDLYADEETMFSARFKLAVYEHIRSWGEAWAPGANGTRLGNTLGLFSLRADRTKTAGAIWNDLGRGRQAETWGVIFVLSYLPP